MSVTANDLDALRREIDQLDDRIHDLLMQRAAAVSRIPALKGAGNGLFLRPGREAQIVRRLIQRHRGAFPAAALARIWREMIAALYRVQGPLRIAVHAPEKSVGYWDLGRSHFGSVTPMTLHRQAATVLRTVSENTHTLGLLALPQEGEADPWWPHLASHAPGTPRIIGRLPFVDDSEGRLESLNAFVVARAEPEPSGEDVSLIALVVAPDAISRGRIGDMLQKANLAGRVLAASASAGGDQLLLLEVSGFVASGDSRLLAFLEAIGAATASAIPLGAYAVPVAPAKAARSS